MTRRTHRASSPSLGSDERRIALLLETLRGCELAVDVELAVSRRVRLLPVPRSALPIVSLRQFGWAAFLGIAAITLGGLGFAGLVGPAAYEFAGSVGRAVTTAIGVLGKPILARLVWLAEHVPYQTLSRLAFDAAGEAAIAVCVAMLALSFLVLTRELTARRIAG